MPSNHQNSTIIVKVRRAIAQAPATCSEIAAELEIPLNHAAVYLGRLHKAGVILRRPAPALWEGNGRVPTLYYHPTHAG